MAMKMMKTSRIAIALILVGLVAIAAPASAVMFNGQSPSVRAERVVELANRAEQRVQDLIDLVYLNTTAIEDAGLIDELDGNLTLFGEGVANVTAAESALEDEDYEGAIANATQALRNFTEVFRSIHIILRDSGVGRGDIVDGQGLLVAMRRALDRIERLRELLPENATDALELLDEAESYLDIEEAGQWLLEGRVSETAHNLTQANQLISQAHQLLKDYARRLNAWRIGNYLRGIYRTRERIRVKFWAAHAEGVNVTAVLESLGYQNWTEFVETIQNMTDNAEGKVNDLRDVIRDLREISRTMLEMERALTREIWRHRHGFGNGNNGNGNGYGNGNGQGGGNGGNN